MPNRLFAALPAAAFMLCLAAPLSAQTSGAPRPDPLDASASVPVTAYKSWLGAYRAAPEQAIAPWRDSNDITARIGGWRAYAREAQGAAPADTGSVPAPSRDIAAPADGKIPMHDGGRHAN